MTFKDLNTANKYYNYIVELAKKGIIAGFPDSTFRPNSEVTRSEFLKLIFLVKGTSLITANEQYFVDVKPNYWQKRYVDTAVKLGLISTKNKNFNPNSFISRVEALKIAIILFKGDINLKYSGNFNDVKETDWFSKYVEYSSKNNLIDNSTNKFSPNNDLKRIEAISIIYSLSK